MKSTLSRVMVVVTLVTWNMLPVSAVIVPPIMVKVELPSLASPDILW